MAGLCFGIGFASTLGENLFGELVLAAIGTGVSILLGFAWTTLTYLIGAKVLGGSSSYWGLARPLFFSVSPGPFFLLMLIPMPLLSDAARAIVLVWMAISSVVVVKTVFGFDGQRSLVTFIVVAIVLTFIYQAIVSYP